MTQPTLIQTPNGLALKFTEKSLLHINFSDKKIKHRILHTRLKKERLIRASGLKKNTQPIVIDATAGMGRDAFIIAHFGFKITLIERSPMIYALLKDALERAKSIPQFAPIVQRMTLIHQDAIDFFSQDPPVDIIFIDSMFPKKNKSALSQKNLQLFQAIVGEDSDASILLAKALSCAKQRVVVKRPRLAAPLFSVNPPDFCLTGKSCRFDVYLPWVHK